MKVLHIETK